MRRLGLAGLLVAALAGAAMAESRDEMALRMQAAETAARAAATLPTDDALTCEQVRSELASIAEQPAYRAHRERLAAEPLGASAPRSAYGYLGVPGLEFAGALAPGLGYAHVAALDARNAQMRRNAEANAIEAIAAEEAALPQIARAERLRTLSHAKQCD